eukprot:g966.t1
MTQGLEIGIVLLLCQGALGCVWYLMGNILTEPTGDAKMQSISDAIREGSNSFFWRVYGTIAKLALPMAVLIFGIYFTRSPTAEFEGIGNFALALFVAFSFVVGAFCSSVAGYVGLWTSTRVNARVAAAAASEKYVHAIQIALRGGAVAAITVVALVLLGVTALFVVVSEVYATDATGDDVGEGEITFGRVPFILVGFGFGASFVALFAQLGGGIFTKAADVGADLVGKVEENIPEDDPRNPAVIADLVGDNVGDCSARGADLFESIAAEIIAAMILGGSLSLSCKLSHDETRGYVLFPLIVHGFDLAVSLCGVYFVDGKKHEQPLAILKRGYSVAMGLAFVGFGIATRWLLYAESAPNAWFHFFMCGVVGMITAYASILTTQYYTDYDYRPVRSIAKASTTGHATNVIAGLAVGLESVMATSVIISIAILSAFWLGTTSGLTTVVAAGEVGVPAGGLFGTAIATMGMLSTAAFVLSMDIFGPIADNAGGIVEMSEQSAAAREITDKLDAVGNTTKAATKGFAVGSAALACFLLVRAFMDEIVAISDANPKDGGEKADVLLFESIDVAEPEVFVGGLLGAATVFLFAAFAMNAVGATAQAVVREVRRQFRELPGIRSGTQKPEYAKCVDIVSSEALRRMIAPGLLATLMPISVGVVFRIFGSVVSGDRLLGAKALTGFLMFSSVTAILLALLLNNAGGAWDNTKKLIETGAYGGKGSSAHKASITGDTVGDPAKDTAGPSLHVLMKMVSTVVLVMAPLFVSGSA